MKWKDFRAWMNEYFDDNDDIRITLTNEYPELNSDIKDIYPVITIAPEESEDDGAYPIFVRMRQILTFPFKWLCKAERSKINE